MENNLKQAFTLIASAINRTDALKGDFYKKILEDLLSAIKFDYGAIYFVDSQNFAPKQIISNSSEELIFDENLHEFVSNSKEHTFVVKNLDYKKKKYNFIKHSNNTTKQKHDNII